MRPIQTAAWAAIVLASASSAWPQVTFAGLLKEMTDLESITRYPDPNYANRQASSYDRRSTDPAIPTDENWFANGDRGQYIRKEERNGETEYVIMDSGGPGAIVRFWSANPDDAGLLRIYLDESDQPAIECTLSDFLGGRTEFAPDAIAGTRARGWNSYLPIPYAKHCKITTNRFDYYYQINYRTYTPGTRVETFSMDLAKTCAADIMRTANVLARPNTVRTRLGKQNSFDGLIVAPGEAVNQAFEGPAAINEFWIKVDAEDPEKALRQLVLTAHFDGEASPSIDVPLGDFFGTAPGPNPFSSIPLQCNPDGMLVCRWVMPFQLSAKFVLTNLGAQPITVTGLFSQVDYEWSPQSMHFNAKWRAEFPIPTQPRQDWNYVTIDGQGVFVGDMLHVSNPVKDWWGEGDEKIYVDGETIPSTFGTGTEDYYGYAWCCPEVFTHAYHNQPRCDGPGNYGQTCVSRFHIIDAIPFTKSFQFDIEVWHWKQTEVAMAATSYWYAKPGSKDNRPPVQQASLKIHPMPELPPPFRKEGALEGESLKVIGATGGNPTVQQTDTWNWSNAAQIWWIDNKPGNVLTLAVPVKKTGRYKIEAVFTYAVDYAIARLSINDQPLGEARDFYDPGVRAGTQELLGEADLKEGENILRIEIVGANPKAKPAHMVGLDYLFLTMSK
ncbi:MAG: hypothetical protein AMXMBFR84_05150 [Candidatus Hydrogenedentota bacterium]